MLIFLPVGDLGKEKKIQKQLSTLQEIYKSLLMLGDDRLRPGNKPS